MFLFSVEKRGLKGEEKKHKILCSWAFETDNLYWKKFFLKICEPQTNKIRDFWVELDFSKAMKCSRVKATVDISPNRGQGE